MADPGSGSGSGSAGRSSDDGGNPFGDIGGFSDSGSVSAASATMDPPPVVGDTSTGADITDDDLVTAVRVLTVLSADGPRALRKRYKDLRRATHQVSQLVQDGKPLYSGLSRHDYEMKSAVQKERNRRDARLRDMDRKRIAASEIRASRIEALNALMEPGGVGASSQLALGNGDEDTASPIAREWQRFGATVHNEDSDSDHSGEGDGGEDGGEDGSGGGKARRPRGGRGKGTHKGPEFYDELAEAIGEDNVLNYPRSCYACKLRFHEIHHFYSELCPSCAALNFEKRNQRADLSGRVIIITGGRIKIGFEAGLILLRCGATLVVTTRFPHDCVARYLKEEDSDEFKDRLHVYGLDLRDLRAVHDFASTILETYDRLDAIVNNAAQTVRRPPMYYQHLLQAELRPSLETSAHVREFNHSTGSPLLGTQRVIVMTDEEEGSATVEGGTSTGADALPTDAGAMVGGARVAKAVPSSVLSQIPLLSGDSESEQAEFPQDVYDVHGQQLDLRKKNSWLMKIDEVDPAELVEVHAINALAPFILNSRLKPLLMRSPEPNRWIVNVSAMEGKFYRHKDANHPHTNMAKASMNMMTRTSAQDYATAGIFMNSVDTGWITDENPFDKAMRTMNDTHWQTPIDEIDAAARIIDPILHGANTGDTYFGLFLKDYRPTEW